MATILSFVKQQQQPGAPQMIKKRRSSGQSEASAATQSKKRPRCQATTSPNRQHQPQPVIDLCGSSEDESGSADLSSSRKTGHVDRKGSSTPAPKERKPQPIELDGSDDSEEEKASAPSQQVCPMCAKKLGKMASSVSVLFAALASQRATRSDLTLFLPRRCIESNRACEQMS